MASFDVAVRRVAKAALSAVGTDVTIRTVTAGSYNTTTGSGSDTVADVTCRARLDAYSADDRPDGFQAGDLQVTVAASALTSAPTTQDRVVIGTSVYEIVTVEQVMAQSLAALYVLQVRGPR